VTPQRDHLQAGANLRAVAEAQEKYLTVSSGTGILIVKFVEWRAVWVTGVAGEQEKAIDRRGRLRPPR